MRSITDRRTLELLSLGAVVAVLFGIRLLDGTDLASTWEGAISGVVGQLPITLLAAILAIAAAVLQLSAGAVAIRWLRSAPYRSLTDAVLSGLVGAVAIGLVALMALGSLGLFRQPVLIGLNAAIIGAGWLARPLLTTTPRLTVRWPPVAGALVVLAWSGPVVLQLASPVVPFIDVLPNHVAPAEHLRTFGSFATLTTAPSPIYGPSRMFLGYTALIGSATVLTGLPAALTAAAFVLPATVLVGVGMVRLATVIHGPGNGWWMLLAFTLTASFARLADVRATVLVLPLVAFCVAELVNENVAENAGSDLRRGMLLAIGLAAAVFVHPLMGALTATTLVAAVALAPERFGTVALPALVGGGVLALPQATTMVGLDLPSVAGLTVVPPALAATWAVSRSSALRGGLLWAIRIGGIFALAAVLGAGALSIQHRLTFLADFFIQYPVLVWTVAVGAIIAGRRMFALMPVTAFVVGLLAVVAAAAIPWEQLGIEGLDFEVAKTLHYWTPVFLAVIGASALAALWAAVHLGLAVRSGLIAVFLLAAALPIRVEPIDNLYLGEHRISETLSIHLRAAEHGFWTGYPDSRTVVDGPRQELIERLRDEVAAGRLRDTTPVLHVAFSFQQWVATPIGVFGGMFEIVASVETEASIHTAGGRLHPFSDLPALLEQRYPYVVLEPRDLPDGARERIVAAGYRSVFGNEQGEIFIRR